MGSTKYMARLEHKVCHIGLCTKYFKTGYFKKKKKGGLLKQYVTIKSKSVNQQKGKIMENPNGRNKNGKVQKLEKIKN